MIYLSIKFIHESWTDYLSYLFLWLESHVRFQTWLFDFLKERLIDTIQDFVGRKIASLDEDSFLLEEFIFESSMAVLLVGIQDDLGWHQIDFSDPFKGYQKEADTS